VADDDQILLRLDRHVARGNELMEEVREQHRLNEETYRQGMEFMAHLTERVLGAIDENIRAIREMREEMKAEGRENRAQIRAQTEAIFRMMDRFDGNSGPATS
jgi:hypothetical protein